MLIYIIYILTSGSSKQQFMFDTNCPLFSSQNRSNHDLIYAQMWWHLKQNGAFTVAYVHNICNIFASFWSRWWWVFKTSYFPFHYLTFTYSVWIYSSLPSRLHLYQISPESNRSSSSSSLSTSSSYQRHKELLSSY